jgi:hypothetical protein
MEVAMAVTEIGGTEERAARQLREVVGVFRDEGSLEAAIDDLLECGFDRADISLLASEDAVVEKLGRRYRRINELEDDLSVPRVAYAAKEDYGAVEGGFIGGLVYVGAIAGAGAVLAAGGAVAAALAAAALAGGTGGRMGLALARWVEGKRAQRLQEQLEKGGLLLWVHVRDSQREECALRVLKEAGGEDVHAHDVAAMTAETEALAPYPPLLALFDSVGRRRPK